MKNKKHKKTKRIKCKTRRRRKRTRRRKMKKRRKKRRSTRRVKKQRGGIRFRISDALIENWKSPHIHKSDCVPCTLHLLGMKNPCVNDLIKESFGKGVFPTVVIDIFNTAFPYGQIDKLNPGRRVVPEKWKSLFKQISPGTAAIARIGRLTSDNKEVLGHAIMFARTSRGTPFLIDPQAGEIIISKFVKGTDGFGDWNDAILKYLQKSKAAYLQILESVYGNKTAYEVSKIPGAMKCGGSPDDYFPTFKAKGRLHTGVIAAKSKTLGLMTIEVEIKNALKAAIQSLRHRDAGGVGDASSELAAFTRVSKLFGKVADLEAELDDATHQRLDDLFSVWIRIQAQAHENEALQKVIIAGRRSAVPDAETSTRCWIPPSCRNTFMDQAFKKLN